ncbi:hypothetical protein BDZ94DRAFT_1271046 [Collybia nuda]|uniref:Uncharacterized protein n=1 Tax=Collybia nuda TaxID=64659 RepID=A0A9P5XV15_9AGAR|nr:hypothetical protein BDZ94DRAFT_1271046 [Collybia nuda]
MTPLGLQLVSALPHRRECHRPVPLRRMKGEMEGSAVYSENIEFRPWACAGTGGIFLFWKSLAIRQRPLPPLITV